MTRQALAVLRRTAKEGPEGGWFTVTRSGAESLVGLYGAGLIDEVQIGVHGLVFARITTSGLEELERLRDCCSDKKGN